MKLMKIIYDQKLMQYLALFENLTKVKLKDIFLRGEVVYFVVFKRDLRRAIGPNGFLIKKLGNLLKKRVRVIGYSENLEEFVGDLLYGFEVEKVEEKEGIVKILCKNNKTKGLLIGRERKNLLGLRNIILRYFKIRDVQVV